MTQTVPDAFVQALQRLPSDTITGQFQGQRYVATKSVFNAGKSFKLVAEELGGADYISLNLYVLASGARLFPFEMSHDKVITFVTGFQPDDPAA